jgi:hypothetical protein
MAFQILPFRASAKRGTELPPEALDELQSFLNTYKRCSVGSATPNLVCDQQMSGFESQLAGDPDKLQWFDLAQAELCTLEYLDIAQLRARAAAWRRRMQEVVGESQYARYLTTAADLKSTDLQQLRADLAECIHDVYHAYGGYDVAARSRSTVTKRVHMWGLSLLAAEALLAVFFGVFLPAEYHVLKNRPMWLPNPSVLNALALAFMTSAAAVLGSIVSVQRRLQDPSVRVDPFYRYIQTTADGFSIAFVSPVCGAICGIVIYGLLVSQLLTTKLLSIGENGLPADAKNCATLLVLGFAAGFLEQLVPDALTGIARRAFGAASGKPEPPLSSEAAAGKPAPLSPASGILIST